MESKDQKASKSSGPTSLFQRIVMQTRKQPISKLTIDDTVQEVAPSVLSNTTSQLNKNDAPHDEGFGSDYADKLISLLLNGKGTVREKNHALKELREYSSDNVAALEQVISKEVISYGEKLLINYCDRSHMTEELKLLVPMLSLFQTFTNVVDTKVYEALMVRQSDFMYQLMRSCVMCVDTILSKSEELIKLTRKKKLAGRVRKLAEEESTVKLARLLGIPSFSFHENDVPKGLVPIESYQVSLFDTTSGNTDKNINEHILSMENPNLVDSSSDLYDTLGLDPVLCQKSEQETSEWVWTDTVVASVLPFGHLLAYTKGDWSHWLQVINGELSEYLRSLKLGDCENDDNLEIKIGSIVGFWSADVKFKWKPLMMMQCFRGIVLGKATGGSVEGRTEVSWAVWAIDIGTLVFGDKFWPLDPNVSSIPPLVSTCSLDMGEGNSRGETLFLFVALKLLSKLLATNPTAGRHMVAFGSRKSDYACDVFAEDGKTCDGGVFLMLISYVHIEIRIEFLKLVMLLARSSSEILRYLLECRFYLAICNRLEICVYFCRMLPSDSPQWSEIRLLVMLLSTMSEGMGMSLTELPGWDRVEKVLLMLTEIDNHTYVRYMAAKCLAGLENHKTKEPSPGKTVKRGPPHGGRSSQYHEANQVREDISNTNKESQKLNRSGSSQRIPRSTPINPAVCAAMDSEAPEPLLSVLDVGDDPSSDEEVSDLPPVDAVADMARQMDRYTKGYRVTINNDMTHELSEEKNANQISENNLAQNICAFLNNGVGGSVYFGINSKGIIEGLKMTRIQRDNFRKGVDRMMTRSIFPEVRPACYDVIYVPVYGPGEVVKGLASHLVWVVEVHVKALPHVIYAVSSNRRCYVRQGPSSIESMSVCLRQEAAEQNKKEILQAIEEAKAKIPETKGKLMTFVKDYLEQSKNIV